MYARCRECRPNALLIVLIREVPRLAYYQIATKSIHNIVNLTGQMRWVKENVGKLQGVPFILERRPDKISTPGKNGRVRREKYLLHLEPDPEWVKAMLSEMHRRALPGAAQEVAAIPAQAGEVVDLDDAPLWEPVEHVDEEDEAPEVESEQEPENGNGRNLAWPGRFIQALLKDNLVNNQREAWELLNGSPFDPQTATPDEVLAWARGDGV